VGFHQVIEAIVQGLDVAGVSTIAGGIALSVMLSASRLWRRQSHVYSRFRQETGRAILLGLELLIAADIIRTVTISPTLESVGVLAGIVLVRTFLSLSLDVELTGTWPWRRTSITSITGSHDPNAQANPSSRSPTQP
jgi:uncharacterized membrane protein